MIKRLFFVCCFFGSFLLGMDSEFDRLPSEIVSLIAEYFLPSICTKNGKTYFINDIPSASKKIAVCADILHFGATTKKNNDIAQELIKQKIGAFGSEYASRSEWLVASLTKKFFKDQPHACLYVAANIEGSGIRIARDYLMQNKRMYANYELRATVLTQAFCRGTLDTSDDKWRLDDGKKRKELDRQYCNKVRSIEQAYPKLAQEVRAYYDYSAENNDMIMPKDNKHRRS